MNLLGDQTCLHLGVRKCTLHIISGLHLLAMILSDGCTGACHLMQSGSDMGDGNGSDSGTVDIINHVAEQDHQIHQLHQAARDHQQALLGQPAVDHQQHLMRHADMQHVGHEHEHLLVHEEQAHHDQQDPLGSLPLVHEQSVG
jgi:hypothetical protein